MAPMKQRVKWMGCLFWAVGVALVCALPWTPLWKPILEVGYSPVLCLLNVDHWFSASGTLTLSDGTGAALSTPDDPARRAEVDRAIWLCNTHYCSPDFRLWTDDPGSGPTVRIRAKAWSPDKARGLVGNVIDKSNAGEGPSSTPSAAESFSHKGIRGCGAPGAPSARVKS